jgi:hypothetical protein
VTKHPHTAALRSPTGLDEGARTLILFVVREIANASSEATLQIFLRDRFPTAEDFLDAVEEVHDRRARSQCEVAIEGAMQAAYHNARNTAEAAAHALLTTMPEPDFMVAIEDTLRAAYVSEDASARVTRICRERGAQWAFEGERGFRWVGDTTIQERLVEPALAAINDPRFSGGVRNEFEQARAELRHGTANGRKKAVHEAGCAVESAMKVALDCHQITYDQRDTGQALFNHLESANLIARFMEPLVFAVLTPRNKTAGHGGGAEALDPGEAEAASVVAAAAGAIAYLHSKLP